MLRTDVWLAPFQAFFERCTGHAPYPWQVEAVRRLLTGDPPAAIHVGTGRGKTSVIICWLFSLSWQSAHGLPRTVAMRLFLVTPRRVLVDDSARLATRAQEQLTKAAQFEPEDSEDPVGRLARALCSLGDDWSPLDVAVLRGGMDDRVENVIHPAKPALVVGTIDLIGSRLLGRPYGVAISRRPIEMGLTGADALIVLDEAHLERQFSETLRILRLQAEQESRFDDALPPRRVLVMTATPTGTPSALVDDDPSPERRERAERRRRMPLTLALGQARDADSSLPTHVKDLEFEPRQAYLIYCNTVATAKKTLQALERRRDLKERGVRVVGLIGGMSEHARKDALEQVAWLRPGAERTPPGGEATIIVTTQVLEVGADLDADHLVTPVASASALIQRLGRVNRLGLRDVGTVRLLVGDAVNEPVYGESAGRLSAALRDGNIQSVGDLLDLLEGPEGPDLEPVPRVPATLPRHVFNAYLRTAGSPHEPPVDAWLHLPNDPLADVYVAFRRSVTLIQDEHALLTHLEVCRPQRGELWSMPISAVEEQMRGSLRSAGTSRAVLLDPARQRPARLVEAGGVRPGMLLVLPSSDAPAFGLASTRARQVDVPDESAAPASEDVEGRDGFGTLRFKLLTEAQVSTSEVTTTAEQVLTALLTENGASSGWYHLLPSRAEEPIISAPYPLEQHLEDVAEVVQRWGTALGLPGHVIEDLTLAGLFHDRGKADERFAFALSYRLDDGGQLVTANGDLGGPIGKSMLPRAHRSRAARLAGVPRGWRHEAASVDLFDAALADDTVSPHDAELVRHLIATHHGHFRPHTPPLERLPHGAALPRLQDPDRPDWADRSEEFWRLNERYGPYTLALAETLLRLADWEASRRIP